MSDARIPDPLSQLRQALDHLAHSAAEHGAHSPGAEAAMAPILDAFRARLPRHIVDFELEWDGGASEDWEVWVEPCWVSTHYAIRDDGTVAEEDDPRRWEEPDNFAPDPQTLIDRQIAFLIDGWDGTLLDVTWHDPGARALALRELEARRAAVAGGRPPGTPFEGEAAYVEFLTGKFQGAERPDRAATAGSRQAPARDAARRPSPRRRRRGPRGGGRR